MSAGPMGLDADLIVVGAGTAGACAAKLAAEAGLSVLVLERKELAEAGARWVNDVPGKAFDLAGVDRPDDDELVGPHGGSFHLVAGWDGPRVSAKPHDLFDVDMRKLVARLQEDAAEAGATLRAGMRVRAVEESPRGITVVTDGERFAGRWVVDASGLHGGKLLGQRKLDGRDICAAAQAQYEVTDRDEVAAFYHERDANLGDAICFSGVAGGYSIVRIISDGETVSVLTGSITASGHPSGKKLRNEFAESTPWVGAEIFGGSRTIPIRRPRDVIGRGRVALLGDAACQVFPAHGSGIGAGMVAAAELVSAIVDGDGCEGYGRRWMRKHGGLMAAYDLFRRFSQDLSVAEVGGLMECGLMDADGLCAGLQQTLPGLAPSTIGPRVKALTQSGSLGREMAAIALKMPAMMALYRGYPTHPTALQAWSRGVATLMGDVPA